MNMHSFNRERLLKEVIEDERYRAFRAQTFQIARRELVRSESKLRHWLGLAAIVALCGVVWWLRASRETAPPLQAAHDTSPLPTDGRRAVMAYVATQPLPVVEVVRSVPDISLVVETSRTRMSSLLMVETHSISVPPLSDAQLLAHFAGRPGGFITRDHVREFILFERSPRSADPPRSY